MPIMKSLPSNKPVKYSKNMTQGCEHSNFYIQYDNSKDISANFNDSTVSFVCNMPQSQEDTSREPLKPTNCIYYNHLRQQNIILLEMADMNRLYENSFIKDFSNEHRISGDLASLRTNCSLI